MASFRFFLPALFCLLLASASGEPAVKLPIEPKLTPLAKTPDWTRLDPYQETITKAEFVKLVHHIYSPNGAFWKYAILEKEALLLFSDEAHRQKLYTLRFAADVASEKSRPRYFFPEPEKELVAPSSSRSTFPLRGIKICLDPGHLGGAWARMEERYFVVGKDRPILEAELNLITCRHIAAQLTALGATVCWTKEDENPVTTLRPVDLRAAAMKAEKESAAEAHHEGKEENPKSLQKEEELLFYRNAEIGARAKKVAALQPDLTVCIHYNAAPWGDPEHPRLVPEDRLVVFVHGNYSHDELSYDDEKFDLLLKLLDRTAPLEEKVADEIAVEIKEHLKLPPESYEGWAATHHAGINPYVFSRNLLANRLFPGPVVFVEGPYMNSIKSYHRLEAGDYDGLREIDGVTQPSIYREYADAVVQGLLHYFKISGNYFNN